MKAKKYDVRQFCCDCGGFIRCVKRSHPRSKVIGRHEDVRLCVKTIHAALQRLQADNYRDDWI